MSGHTQPSAESDVPLIALQGGLVLVPDNHWASKSVVLDGGLIRDVSSDPSAASGATVIDVSGSWLLPGLIDAHVHLGLAQGTGVSASPDQQRTTGVENAWKCLRAGVTSVRDLGSSTTVNIDLARDIESGRLKGPSVIAAGRPITSVGGHLSQIGYEAKGSAGIRDGVRQQIEQGAACIKVVVSADALEPDDSQSPSQFSQREIEAAVEEAHQVGAEVTVHAHGRTAIRDSLRAGADSIEHANFLDEWSLSFLSARTRWIVPTLAVYLHLADADDLPSEIRRKAQEVLDRKLPLLGDAIQRGVRVGVGSDAATHFPHGAVVEEIEALAEAGLGREAALAAATSGNADLLGIARRTGTLEVGKRADLLVVGSDPRDGFEGLRHPKMVIRGGELFEPQRGEPTPWERYAESRVLRRH